MYVTHETARKMACPMAREGPDPYCRGAFCMAWIVGLTPKGDVRWCDERNSDTMPKRPDDVPPGWTFRSFEDNEGAGACWVEDDASAAKRTPGTCGMVGTVTVNSAGGCDGR